MLESRQKIDGSSRRDAENWGALRSWESGRDLRLGENLKEFLGEDESGGVRVAILGEDCRGFPAVVEMEEFLGANESRRGRANGDFVWEKIQRDTVAICRRENLLVRCPVNFTTNLTSCRLHAPMRGDMKI